MTEADLIRDLDLQPHPEGGWYRQTWAEQSATRPCGTAIYYLLEAGCRSHWHRVDATEIWHFYAGSPLRLLQSADETGPVTEAYLGSDFTPGQSPQIIIPKDHWQSAETTDGWSLVGCTVSPGFRFEGFEMAPQGWSPGGSTQS